jgi:hypothetical protein
MPPSKSYPCPEKGCLEELPTIEALKEHRIKVHGAGATVTPAPTGEPPKPAPVPVKATDAPWRKAAEEIKTEHKKAGVSLVYKYTGFCPDCDSEVETIVLDDVLKDKERCIVLCWCPKCKRKIKQRSVGVL